jgi:hypothetical protein
MPPMPARRQVLYLLDLPHHIVVLASASTPVEFRWVRRHMASALGAARRVSSLASLHVKTSRESVTLCGSVLGRRRKCAPGAADWRRGCCRFTASGVRRRSRAGSRGPISDIHVRSDYVCPLNLVLRDEPRIDIDLMRSPSLRLLSPRSRSPDTRFATSSRAPDFAAASTRNA